MFTENSLRQYPAVISTTLLFSIVIAVPASALSRAGEWCVQASR